MNILLKDNPDEFYRFFQEKVDLSMFPHKYLSDYIKKVRRGQNSLYDSSIINISSSGWILILHGEILLAYGDKWNQKQIAEINEAFNLNKYSNYLLAGNEELIIELIEAQNVKRFKVEKRRLFYQTDNVKSFINEDVKIQLGKLNDLNELALMLQQYYHEEYNGLNEKTIDEMQKRMLSSMENQKVYVLNDKHDVIVGFCTILDPDIGILFTKKEHRNRGYGKIILAYCSILLQKKNGVVYLMTDKDKIESNVVCNAIGFESYYNYIMVELNYD